MKRTILICIAGSLCAFTANAQLKVSSDSTVCVGAYQDAASTFSVGGIGNGSYATYVHGKGKVDLNAMRIDMDVTVDMRGLPVIPVYVVGPLAKPETKVSGARVVLNTFTGIIQGTAGFVGGFFRLFRR